MFKKDALHFLDPPESPFIHITCNLFLNRRKCKRGRCKAFIHFSYIAADIIGCVDGKYEHNSTEATCRPLFHENPLPPYIPSNTMFLSLFLSHSSFHRFSLSPSLSRFPAFSRMLHWRMTLFPIKHYASCSVFPSAD